MDNCACEEHTQRLSKFCKLIARSSWMRWELTQSDNRNATDIFHDWTEDNWADGIYNAKANHNVTDSVDTHCTWHVSLFKWKPKITEINDWIGRPINIRRVTWPWIYLSEISTDERLFHSNPNCDRHQELLVAFLALVHCGRQQCDAGQFFCRFGTLAFFTISVVKRDITGLETAWNRANSRVNLPWQWIQEECNNQYSAGNTGQIDGRDFIDFRIWWTFQVGIFGRCNNTEIGTALSQSHFAVAIIATAAAAMSTARQYQATDQISPQFSRLPGQEEESKEAHNDRVDRLVGDLCVHLTALCQIGSLWCPHRCRTQTQQNTGRN